MVDTPVTREDREAAAKLAHMLMHNGVEAKFNKDFPHLVRQGVWDNHPLVQAFARHRLSVPAADGWRDIGSAPLTGFFMVWSPVHPDCPMVVKGEILHGALERERDGRQPAHLSFGHFTHWMPLPAAPKEPTHDQ